MSMLHCYILFFGCPWRLSLWRLRIASIYSTKTQNNPWKERRFICAYVLLTQKPDKQPFLFNGT